jgi:hypothetical protein
MVCYVAGSFSKAEFLIAAGKNMLCFWAVLGAVLGLSCVVFLGKRIKGSRGRKIAFVLGMVLLALIIIDILGLRALLGVMALIGWADMLKDFRRISRGRL